MKDFREFSNNKNISTIKYNRVKNLDIDPYGEEDWDVFEINWDDINIVHPYNSDDSMGKNVLIIKDTRYYSDYKDNPSDVIGKITRYIEGDHGFIVSWNNGGSNSYNAHDLTLINVKED